MPINTTIKVAACQMQSKLGDVSYNLKHAEELIQEGFNQGAQWVVIPEFFTTGIGFHPSLIGGALPLEGIALELLTKSAKRYNGYVAGSFIAIQGGGRYNTFVLAKPDGTYATHNKDIPTLWENCYFRGGSDDGVIKTDDATIGAVICWEIIRWQTARRLKGKIDFVTAVSAWWGMPNYPPFIKKVFNKLEKENLGIVHNSPGRLARILGVPVVYAAHAGEMHCRDPLFVIPYHTYYAGQTQITDNTGNILAIMSEKDGAGVIAVDITLIEAIPQEPLQDALWIPRLPWELKLAWRLYNAHGKRYYQKLKQRGFQL